MDEFSRIKGCYKLSAYTVKRLTSRIIRLNDGSITQGATKNMISSMIYFSHICSQNGAIHNFKISDLSIVLHCSIRSVYNVLNDLSTKGFIRIEKTAYTGVRDIVLLGNDFSSAQKSIRYLNTNREFFDYRQNQGYEEFMNLSLYSMRLFLNLLLNYNEKNGYHVSFDTLCSQINVKKRALIHRYLEEIRTVIKDDIFKEKKNVQKKLKYGSLLISNNQECLIPEYGLNKNQDSYYNYHWKSLIRILEIEHITTGHSLHSQAGRICAIVSDFLKKGLSLQLIENTVIRILTDHGILNDHTFTDIYTRLVSLT